MTTTPLELLAIPVRHGIAETAVELALDNEPELISVAGEEVLAAAMFVRLVKPRPSLYAAARDAVDLLMAVEEVARPADLLAALLVGLETAAARYTI